MIYSITAGVLSTDDGEVILEKCYSGGDAGLRPEAVNNPAYCHVRPNVGPLPPAHYTIGPLANHVYLGPAMALTPDPGSQMFGGSDFYIHYCNPKRDAGLAPYPPVAGRNSSDGCIVLTVPGSIQDIEARRAAGDNRLEVRA